MNEATERACLESKQRKNTLALEDKGKIINPQKQEDKELTFDFKKCPDILGMTSESKE